MSRLPKGWEKVRLGEVVAMVPNIKPEDCPDQEFGYVDISSIDNTNFKITEAKKMFGRNAPSRARRPIQANDVLFSNVRTYLRNIALVLPETHADVCSTGFTVLRPSAAIDHRYLFRYVLTDAFIDKVTPQQTGTHYPATSDRVVVSEEIPLPPLNEQRRIVAKLEAVLGKVDACQQRLAKIPVILKRFRQAVLAAACSGRLTADWREEREGAVGANLVFAQKQGQSQGLPLQDRGEVEGLPGGWHEFQLSELAEIIDPNPSHRYPSYENGTVPILATEQFSGMDGWNFNKAKLAHESFYEERKKAHGFNKDDIIFARKGRLGLARRPPSIERYTFSHTIFIVRAKKKISSSYLLWFLRQDSCVTWLLNEMNSNTGVPTLGKAYMERFPVHLPPLPEQHEIVRQVEALFTLADQLEARYLKAKAHVDRLTQSILAKAFRGELVPQDENDEPAAALLERIRAVGATRGVAQKPKATSGRGSASPLRQPTATNRAGLKPAPTIMPLVAETPASYGRNIPQAILAQMQFGVEYSRAEITSATGITAADWTWAIRQLKDEGMVLQTGERRGARYRKPS